METIYSKRFRERRKAQNLCWTCGLKPPHHPNGSKCRTCLDKDKTRINALRTRRVEEGLCPKCGKNPPDKQDLCRMCLDRINLRKEQTSYYEQNREKLRASVRSYVRTAREVVVKHYGGKCVCCGEAEDAFLTIDHIANNGAEHRRTSPGASQIYVWLKTHDFPAGFQILCANCHIAKTKLGICPHQTKEGAEHVAQHPTE